jgi:hypothetical protein
MLTAKLTHRKKQIIRDHKRFAHWALILNAQQVVFYHHQTDITLRTLFRMIQQIILINNPGQNFGPQQNTTLFTCLLGPCPL